MNQRRVADAAPARRTVSGGGRRLIIASIALIGCLAAGTNVSVAADGWGGSIALTSDYLVRGVSRSAHRAALQGDLHVASHAGFFAGIFASSAQIDPHECRDVELNAFLGLAREIGRGWRGKLLLSRYAHPWNQYGSNYEYDELDIEAAYNDWLSVRTDYSPDTQRYLPNRGYTRVASKAAEINLRLPARGRLSASTGLGYVRLDGPPSVGYVYWSAGADYDLSPVTLALSYVYAGPGARELAYDGTSGGRWMGTLIWRF